MNILNIFVIFAIFSLILVGSLYFLDKFFGKSGLLTLSTVVVLLSNIIVLKRFGIWNNQSLTMSVLVYPFIFVIASFIANKYGQKEATKYANLTVIANILFIVIMTISTFAIPATGTEKNPVDAIFSILDKSKNINPGLIGMNIFGLISLYSALYVSGIVNKLLSNKFKVNFVLTTIISSFLGSTVDSIIFVVFGLYLVSGFLPLNSVVVEIVFMIIAKTLVSTINSVLVSFNSKKNEDPIINENVEIIEQKN